MEWDTFWQMVVFGLFCFMVGTQVGGYHERCEWLEAFRPPEDEGHDE